MRQHEGGAEATEHLCQLSTCRVGIGQGAIANSNAKQLSAQQSRRGGHLATANGGKIRDGFDRLALVAPAEDAEANCRSVCPGTGQGPGTQQLRVVGMSDDGEDAVVGKVEFHGRGVKRET
jgi:hypothetical protein